MNKNTLKKMSLMLLLLLLGTGGAYAQELGLTEAAVFSNIDLPSFFICLVGGVLLAIGFQTVLTLLSVATGVTAVGDLEKKGHKDKTYSEKNHEDYKDEHSSTSTAVKISTGLGVWTLITVSVSLFFASWLAVNLSLIDVNFIGVSLGLIIWASFFTLMVYLEMKMVSSLLGGLMNTAFSLLRGGFNTVNATASGVFGKSQESEMKDVAKYTIDHARKEIAGMLDTRKVDHKIDDWVKTLKPDYTSLRKELESLINDIEVKEEQSLGKEGVTKEMFLNVTGAMPSMSKQDKKKLGDVFDQIKGAAKGAANTKGSKGDKALAGVDKLAPGSPEDTQEFRKKVEQYLQGTDREEISPDKLKQDLEEILSHPSRAPQVIMNRVNQFDKNTLVSVLEQRKDISHQDAQKYAGYAEQALNTIKAKFSDTQGKLNTMADKVKGSSGDGQDKDYSDLSNAEIHMVKTERGEEVVATAPAVNGKPDKETTSRVEGRLRHFFEEMPGQEWDYDRLKRDFVQIYHDPASAPSVLQQRLKQYDKNSMMVLLESTGVMSREQAEKVAAKAEEARDEVIGKANEIEEQARLKVQQAKDFALHQAENTRRSAVAAAWWLVATALVSGAAAALGGMAAL